MTENKKANLKYPRGTIISFEEGEYSDFQIVCVGVTLVDCDFKALAQEYHAVRDKTRFRHRVEGFPSWLVAKQLITPVDYTPLYIGSYGRFDSDFEINEEG